MTDFFKTCVNIPKLPTPPPPHILEIVTPKGPDWTSLAFRELFSASTLQLPSLQLTTEQCAT